MITFEPPISRKIEYSEIKICNTPLPLIVSAFILLWHQPSIPAYIIIFSTNWAVIGQKVKKLY